MALCLTTADGAEAIADKATEQVRDAEAARKRVRQAVDWVRGRLGWAMRIVAATAGTPPERAGE